MAEFIVLLAGIAGLVISGWAAKTAVIRKEGYIMGGVVSALYFCGGVYYIIAAIGSATEG